MIFFALSGLAGERRNASETDREVPWA